MSSEVKNINNYTGNFSFKFKIFGYLYNEEQFIAALANDVESPKIFKSVRKNNELPVFTRTYSASVDFYLREVLSRLNMQKEIGLLVSGGGCLQALLPPKLAEY